MDPDSNSRRGARAPGDVRITVTDGRGRPVRDGGLARWLAALSPSRVRGEVAIALVSDAHIRKLNKHYRRKDRPTDVLSFPADAPGLLGDVVISTQTARRQAREMGHAYATELRVLALHGFLHLLGYDHEKPDDAGRMARAEARLRRKGQLQHGLIARTRA